MVQALYCLAIAGGKQGSSNANVSTPQNAVAISLVCTSEQERLQDAAVEAINSATGVSAGSAKTDEEGRFELILPAGTYQLNVSAAGYSDAQVKDITVRNGEVFYLDWIVLPTPLKDFTIPKDMTLTIGETEVIEPDTDPDGATGYNLHWTSSDASVATVSPEGAVGIITSKAKGSTVITASLALGGQTISKSTNVRVASQGRDTVLVLDVSGSMNGDPLREMKASAINFCHELLADAYNNRVGLVYYDSDVAAFDLTNDVTSLITKINSLSAGSMTNMEGGLAAAKEMMDAQGKADYIKNIVVMADGLPNAGKTSNSGSFQSAAYASSGYYHAVIDTALSIKRSYHLYSLGFFHSLANKDDALALMQQIAMSDQDFYIVDQAENLQFAFGDIAESISNGAKIVINIACPVDAAVTYQGEQLNSAANQYA
ncbi:MAG: VWA domain-containing protein, partial [Peptococcaceae bacterium]|nr:VWA domain-containing protein [Peptococcaceae bacterium]